ncbi:hypothetical protein GCM10007205_12960 [Oxalicibacterium flavum]|uniref:Glycosyltransferase family 1 protein n=1 Tax=Oxalicibacterium flavum TaxID=179467 RepID=A0A8J2UQ81_9BURK|nr:glycosyltransferase family 4 protein [Oxalicibacterium flavum]GGC05173.1 hypothetical protein GCM10007205_12960 [Oxalicibacterium flavum]
MISGKRILVITDRYPPFAEGGAEISLHILLKQIVDANNQVAVITLNEQLGKVEKTNYQGVEVFKVPYSSRWPTVRSNSIKRRRNFFASRHVYLLMDGAKYIFSDFNYASILKRLRKLRLALSLKRSRKIGFLPIMDEEISDVKETLVNIKKIASSFNPQLVHADNFRSILLASRIDFGVPVVAQVRDNRFYCIDRSQSMNIDGRICNTCNFECAQSLSDSCRKLVKRQLFEDKKFRQAALRKADKVIVTSRFLQQQVAEIVPADKMCLVPNPAGEYDLAERQVVYQASPPEILIVGMLNANKGQLEIIKWLEKLGAELSDFKITLAGRGDNVEKSLRRSLAMTGHADRVAFTGYLSREELYRAYARATVVACPNKWPEPFGRVPLEAGISKKPVVAYAVGGIVESIAHGQTGLLVPPGDTEGFIDAIIKIIKNPHFAENLGIRARENILQKYSQEISVKCLSDCWESVS